MCYLVLARICELIISNRNTKNLLKIGAKEYYNNHYKFLVLFHVIFISYFLIQSFSKTDINYFLLQIFLFIQVLRFKIIFDLGKFWTTRIIVLENKKLIKKGLYKYFKHPNYFVVYLEVFLICLIFENYNAMIFFCPLNTVLLFIRIFYEDRANKNRL